MSSRRGTAVGVTFCNANYDLGFQRTKLNVLSVTEQTYTTMLCPATLVMEVGGKYINPAKNITFYYCIT